MVPYGAPTAFPYSGQAPKNFYRQSDLQNTKVSILPVCDKSYLTSKSTERGD